MLQLMERSGEVSYNIHSHEFSFVEAVTISTSSSAQLQHEIQFSSSILVSCSFFSYSGQSMWIWRRQQGVCSGRFKPITDIQVLFINIFLCCNWLHLYSTLNCDLLKKAWFEMNWIALAPDLIFYLWFWKQLIGLGFSSRMILQCPSFDGKVPLLPKQITSPILPISYLPLRTSSSIYT